MDLDTIKSIIEGLAEYKDGWYDGVEGVAATPQSIKEAIIFFDNLGCDRIHRPHVSLARDGEVNFWWEIDTIKLDLGFYGDGTYSCYALLSNGQKIFLDDQAIASSLPPEILTALLCDRL